MDSILGIRYVLYLKFIKHTTLLNILHHAVLAGTNILHQQYLFFYSDVFLVIVFSSIYYFVCKTSDRKPDFYRMTLPLMNIYMGIFILYGAINFHQRELFFLYIIIYTSVFTFFLSLKKSFVRSLLLLLYIPAGLALRHLYPSVSATDGDFVFLQNTILSVFVLLLIYCHIYYFFHISKLTIIFNFEKKIEKEIEVESLFSMKKKVYRIKIFKPMQKEESIYEKVEENSSVYFSLFERIELFMRAEKPWINYDYTIKKLSRDMSSNTLYVSTAINKYSGLNFNKYINSYRLKAFMEEIDKGKDKRLIKEIFLNVGFDNQSTFNRAFKSQYSVSPQEYFSNLESTQKE